MAVLPYEIIVGYIVRAIEVLLDIIDCEGLNCPLTPSCLLNSPLDEAAAAFAKALPIYAVNNLERNRLQLRGFVNAQH